MKALLVSWDPKTREAMRLAVAGVERQGLGPITFFEEPDGIRGLATAEREQPEIVVADEITSGAGAFALARELKGAERPFAGAIVILLDRPQDARLARWSGADAWFVKPVDPFALAARIIELVRVRESA